MILVHFAIRPKSVTYSTRGVQPHSSFSCYLLTPGLWPLSCSDFDLVSTDGRFYLLLLFIQSFVLCPHNCNNTMFPQSSVMKLKYHFNIQLWECPLFFVFFWKGGFEFQWKSGEEFLNLECFREAAMTWIIRGKNVAFCTPHKSMWKTKANIPKRNDICSIVKDCKHVFWACSEIWAVTGVYVVDLKVLRSNRLGHEVIAGMNNQYIFSPGVIPLFACTTV